jgi:hypothetical protein
MIWIHTETYCKADGDMLHVPRDTWGKYSGINPDFDMKFSYPVEQH